MSLRLRLVGLLAMTFAISLLIGAALIVNNVKRSLNNELEANLQLYTSMVSLLFRDRPDARTAEESRRVLADLFGAIDSRQLRLIAGDGGQITAAEPTISGPIAAPDWFVAMVRPDPVDLYRVVRIDGGQRQIAIQAVPDAELEEAWRESVLAVQILISVGALAMLLVFFVVGRALRPLDALSDGLGRIERGDLAGHLPLVGVPDVDVLSQRFNHLVDVLASAQEENRMLTERALAIREQERRRLAQELHDEMGQSISAIKALAVSIAGHAKGDTRISDSAETIADVSTQTYDSVRRMMVQLRPLVLDELGLKSALDAMVDEWNDRHEDSFCRLTVNGDPSDLPDEFTINVYRIIQEALTNIARHADAEHVDVELVVEGGPPRSLALKIADDGSGFDPDTQPRGLGLLGIRERVAAMRGKMSLRTAPGEGTRYDIQALIPDNHIDVTH